MSAMKFPGLSKFIIILIIICILSIKWISKGIELIIEEKTRIFEINKEEIVIIDTIVPPINRQLKIALLNVWTGVRPATTAFAKSSSSCVNDPRVDIIAIVDSNEKLFHLNENKAKIVRIPNITEFFHSRINDAFPSLLNHPHYSLGRKICDYRYLFGYIFKDLLKDYTHWGWIDAHAFIGNILGPISNYGKDFETFDAVSVLNFKSPRDVKTRGSFSVFKNNEKMVNFFHNIPRIEEYLGNEYYFGVDEIYGPMTLLPYPDLTFAMIGHVGFLDFVQNVRIEDNSMWADIILNDANNIQPCEGEISADFYFGPPTTKVSLSKQQDKQKINPYFGTLFRKSNGDWYFRCHPKNAYKIDEKLGIIISIQVPIGSCRNCNLCPAHSN